MKKDLTGVILAGGKGNRFWPLTTDKSLFPYCSKPLIEHTILSRLPSSITRLVIITNNMNNTALSALTFPVPAVTVIQPSALGMADAILSAESELRNSSLYIMNSDDISTIPYFDNVIALAREKNAWGAIPGYKAQHYLPGGYLVTDGTTITGLAEKPGEGNEPSPYIAMLGHYISDGNMLLDELKHTHSDSDDVYEIALSTLMKRHPFVLYPYQGEFASLKYPWHVLNVMNILMTSLPSYRGKNLEIRPNVCIEGKVYIDDNVRIFENSKIIGPAYIGKGTIIGNNNIIRHSHIGSNCVTGFNTDITRSYIGHSCWFHSNYIGDSVLEEDISMGSGAVLANLRLDDEAVFSIVKDERVSSNTNKLGAVIGKHVRIGVNSSIMPGIKIGHGTFIGSGMVLDKDIPDDSYCYIKSSYTILRNSKSLSGKDRNEFRKNI